MRKAVCSHCRCDIYPESHEWGKTIRCICGRMVNLPALGRKIRYEISAEKVTDAIQDNKTTETSKNISKTERIAIQCMSCKTLFKVDKLNLHIDAINKKWKCQSCGNDAFKVMPTLLEGEEVTNTNESQPDYNADIPVVTTEAQEEDKHEEGKADEITKANRKTKQCPYCGEEILEVAKKCKHCGEIIDPVLIKTQAAIKIAEERTLRRANTRRFESHGAPLLSMPQQQTTNVFAVLTIATAGVGLLILPIILGPLAIIFGIVALVQISNNSNQEGVVSTWIGLIVGFFEICWVLYWIIKAQQAWEQVFSRWNYY